MKQFKYDMSLEERFHAFHDIFILMFEDSLKIKFCANIEGKKLTNSAFFDDLELYIT